MTDLITSKEESLSKVFDRRRSANSDATTLSLTVARVLRAQDSWAIVCLALARVHNSLDIDSLLATVVDFTQVILQRNLYLCCSINVQAFWPLRLVPFDLCMLFRKISS
jgi:uncharacterized membrane protein YhfC